MTVRIYGELENRNIIALKLDKDVTTGLTLRCKDHVKQVTLRHFDGSYDPGKKYPIPLRVAKAAIESCSGTATNNRTALIEGRKKIIGSIMGAKKIALRLENRPAIVRWIKFESADMKSDLKPLLDEYPVK